MYNIYNLHLSFSSNIYILFSIYLTYWKQFNNFSFILILL